VEEGNERAGERFTFSDEFEADLDIKRFTHPTQSHPTTQPNFETSGDNLLQPLVVQVVIGGVVSSTVRGEGVAASEFVLADPADRYLPNIGEARYRDLRKKVELVAIR